MAYACGHPDRSHYSSGMCQNCYLAKYYLKRNSKQEEKAKSKVESETKSITEVTSCKSEKIVPKRSFTENDLMISSAKKQKTEEIE